MTHYTIKIYCGKIPDLLNEEKGMFPKNISTYQRMINFASSILFRPLMLFNCVTES